MNCYDAERVTNEIMEAFDTNKDANINLGDDVD